MANVLASVAAYENEVRSERIRAGQAVAHANGKRWGGSERLAPSRDLLTDLIPGTEQPARGRPRLTG